MGQQESTSHAFLAYIHHHMPTRRLLCFTSAASCLLIGQHTAHAETQAGLRNTAARLPGYGPPDVVFPPEWRGSWRMERTVKLGQQQDEVPRRFVYPVRFVGTDVEANGVVADRGYNQANLETQLFQTISGPDRSSEDDSSMTPTVKWNVANPNVLLLQFANGRNKEIKVTARRQQSDNSGTMESSEVQRITLDNGGIPDVSARRVVQRWHEAGPNRIEGTETVYRVLDGGSDPMTYHAGSGTASPQVLSRSTLVLTR